MANLLVQSVKLHWSVVQSYVKRHKVSSAAPGSFHVINSRAEGRQEIYVYFYMLTGVKLTKSGIPIPLDSAGNEMCLLFIKYGRCRFKKKCKKSHWTPPLPDGEYPQPPPLPPSPPPSFPDIHQSTERQVTSQHIHTSEEQQHNVLHMHVADKTKFDQKSILNFENNTTGEASTDDGCPNLDSFLDSQQLMDQSIIYGRVQDQAFDATHKSSNFRQNIIQEQTNSVFACTFTSNKSSTSPTFVVDIKDLTKNTAKGINDLKNTIECSTDVDVNLTMQGLEKKVLEKTVQVINQGKCRFDYLYHHDREAKETSLGFKSSIVQSYENYGAYYDNVGQKLQVNHQLQNKVEKKRLKLLRKAHWNTLQVLKTRLAQLPPSYHLKVNFDRVNFSRLRPYFYLLVQQCFFSEDPAGKRWMPTSFSCLVAETLIAFFTNCNFTPAEAEKKMQDWGARPVRVRQCMSHMWNIIVKSSLSSNGVAQEVVDCEQQVFTKKLCAVDYAYACSLARPLVKANEVKPTSTISKAIRQGIHAAKRVSLAEQKRKHLKSPRLRENYRVQIKAVAVERNSGTPHNGSVKRKAVTWKKKRKTRRSRQISLLDEQGKEDLQKRCKTILDNLTDG